MTFAAGPLAAFDTETTGKDPATCRLVSATTAITSPDSDPSVIEYLVAVDVDIPAEATEVHGITTERARAEGRPLVETLTQIVYWLDAAWKAGIPVVGQNIAYDFTVLDCELSRCGLPPLVIRGAVIDTLVIDKALDRYRRGKRTLTAMAEFYGVPFTGAHDATADALAAAGVARAMSARAADALHDPDRVAALYSDRRQPRELVRAWQRLCGIPQAQLFRLQQQWAQQQATSFATYLRQEAAKARVAAGAYDEGDPDGEALLAVAAEKSAASLSVSGEWPVRRSGRVVAPSAVAPPVCQLPACGCSGLAHP